MNDQINGAGKKLENAFQLFNQFSEKLADSYGDLVNQVARLSKELADERNKRLIQLTEKERLARQLESLFDALPAGVVVLDAQGGITQTNRVAHDMLELKSKHGKNSKWETIAADTLINEGDELRLNDGRWISLSACQLNEAQEKIMLIFAKGDVSDYLNSENEFEINIKDNGCGMTQQTAVRVLEPFFTTRANGTGLGLAVVNATVNRYSGQLHIDAKPGEGCNINIQFLRAQKNGLLHSNLSLIDTNSNKQTIHSDAKVSGDQEVDL